MERCFLVDPEGQLSKRLDGEHSDDSKWQMLEDYGEFAYLKCLGYITVFACLSCLPHSFITLVFIINYTGLENQY